MAYEEYLRRNLIHATACGIDAAAKVALDRLKKRKTRPQWLIRHLDSIIERTPTIIAAALQYRDESPDAPK